MRTALEELLEIIASDPLPEQDTSSHWRQHGSETVVERNGDRLVLKPSGFEVVMPMSFRGRALHGIERASYWPVTATLSSFRTIWNLARRLTGELGGHPNFYVLKSACALSVLADHWAAHRLSPVTFALIGDGQGFLGSLIRRYRPGARLYHIDLPKALAFQMRTHERNDPRVRMSLLADRPVTAPAERPSTGLRTLSPSLSRDERSRKAQDDVVFVLPRAIEWITDSIDCAVNIASMGEMRDESIRHYFAFLRRRSTLVSRFYCVNRDQKVLPGGELTQFDRYPWQPEDEIFLDGPCPYYTHFFTPKTLAHGPRLLGMRIPYVNYFDGMLKHRLVRLAPS